MEHQSIFGPNAAMIFYQVVVGIVGFLFFRFLLTDVVPVYDMAYSFSCTHITGNCLEDPALLGLAD
mgnify:CR=1 FL=1